jgi:methylenetetrahydrofolate dehydrogenase (NADP+)/methenyltetrahydrofolate cyclohydrolase
MAKIIDGKAISAQIREEIALEVKDFERENGFVPGLAVIIVGEDPASKVYVRNKKKACETVGFYSEVIEMPEQTSEEELLSVIDKLNSDSKIHGILVQLPLPKHINEESVLLRIDPKKDVDAFHPFNVGKIMTGGYSFVPCTPAGVMELIKRSGVELRGKECVIVGRSNIVGSPRRCLCLRQTRR